MGDDKNTDLEAVDGGVGIDATAGAEASNEIDVDPGLISSVAGGAFPTAVNAEEPLKAVEGGAGGPPDPWGG